MTVTRRALRETFRSMLLLSLQQVALFTSTSAVHRVVRFAFAVVAFGVGDDPLPRILFA